MPHGDDVVVRSYLTQHPRVLPLVDGRVAADGIVWEWLLPPGGGFRGVSSQGADVFEYSLSGYLLSVAHEGTDRKDWIALPIFLSRATDVIARLLASTSIHGWSDLRGRRIAVPDVGMTAAIWMRVVLRDVFAIDFREMEWWNIRQPEEMHTEELGVGYTLAGCQLKQVPRGANALQLIAEKELDVALAGGPMDRALPANVEPLANPGELRHIVTDFTESTGAAPINHVLLIRKSLLQEHPGIDLAIYDLIERAKQQSYVDARRQLETLLLFPEAVLEEQQRSFGEDPYPVGVSANRTTLTLLIDQLIAEGQLHRRLDEAEYFADGLLDT